MCGALTRSLRQADCLKENVRQWNGLLRGDSLSLWAVTVVLSGSARSGYTLHVPVCDDLR